MKTVREALAFIKRHGIVLESSRGTVPSLAGAIVGKPIRGSWWSHPQGRLIFNLTRGVRDHADILVCRLIDGKITFVHRRMWRKIIATGATPSAIREEHTASGKHRLVTIPFPKWVPKSLRLAIRPAK